MASNFSLIRLGNCQSCNQLWPKGLFPRKYRKKSWKRSYKYKNFWHNFFDTAYSVQYTKEDRKKRLSTSDSRFAHTFALQVAGGVEGSRKEWATRGERAAVVRHQDNLRLETGEFVGKHLLCAWRSLKKDNYRRKGNGRRCAVWRTEYVQFPAALAILLHHDLKKRTYSSFSSYHPGAIPPFLQIILVQNM